MDIDTSTNIEEDIYIKIDADMDIDTQTNIEEDIYIKINADMEIITSTIYHLCQNRYRNMDINKSTNIEYVLILKQTQKYGY